MIFARRMGEQDSGSAFKSMFLSECPAEDYKKATEPKAADTKFERRGRKRLRHGQRV